MFRIDRRLIKIDDNSAPPSAKEDASTTEMPDELLERARTEADALLAEAQKRLAEAEARALEILDGAKREAEQIAGMIKAAAEEGLKAAAEKARSEGYADGTKKAEAEAARRRAEDSEALGRALAATAEARKRIYAEFEGELLELALAVARKVIADAAEADGEVFRSMVVKAIGSAGSAGRITVRLSEEDQHRFFPSGTAEFLIDGEKVQARIIRDAALSELDCIIETGVESLNAGIDSQLGRVAAAFDKNRGASNETD